MSANATWDSPPPRKNPLLGLNGFGLGLKNKQNISSKGSQGKLGNARWEAESSGSQSSLAGSGSGLSLSSKGSSRSSGLDAFNLLSKRFSEKKGKNSSKMTSASTSALSNLPYYSYGKPSKASMFGSSGETVSEELGEQMPPQKLKLRKETLMSLGIKTKPKGCMKSTASGGMRRATTLNSLRETEITLPTGKTIRRNISITFNEKVRSRRIPSSSSFTELDKQEMWFQKDEMKMMRWRSKDLVNEAADNPHKNSREDLRGLEGHLPENRKVLKNRQYQTWDTVLDTQMYQQEAGIHDDEQIATMIRVMSNISLREAQHRAQLDVNEVLGCEL
jgi:hypothetical protein